MPEVKQRKGTCSACKALSLDRCVLGYATEIVKGSGWGCISRRKPAEPCPRPLTIKQFFSSPKQWEK